MSLNIYIGLVVHNEGKYLAETISSLLSQTYHDFNLLILDDASIDDTKSIALSYAKKDSRISYYRNKARLGYVKSCNKCFYLAPRRVKYFAWAAGHDIYHSKWLKELVKTLEENSDAALAYPNNCRIDKKGKKLNISSTLFSTKSMDEKDRIRKTCRTDKVGFGNMIYGLFRASLLQKTGLFPYLLMPDMYLLSVLSLYGTIIQIPKVLWFRRFVGKFSVNRQKQTVFTKTPFYAHLPWPIVNTLSIFWRYFLFPKKDTIQNRVLALELTDAFFIGNFPTTKVHYPVYGKYFLILLPIYQFIKKNLLRFTRIKNKRK